MFEVDNHGVDDFADYVCNVVVDSYGDGDVDKVDCGGGR